MLSVKKEISSTFFLVFGLTRPGIEPRSPGPLANTLLIRLMCGRVENATWMHNMDAN